MVWYIIQDGRQVGPLQKSDLLNYNINGSSMVWHEGMANWQPASAVAELQDLLNGYTPGGAPRPQCPPQHPEQGFNQGYGQGYGQGYNQGFNQGYYQKSDKSKVTAGILALLLGGLGIQYFYLGKVGGGFITILLTLVTCGIWEIITFIQGILMLTMSDQEFDQKFVYTDKTFPLF